MSRDILNKKRKVFGFDLTMLIDRPDDISGNGSDHVPVSGAIVPMSKIPGRLSRNILVTIDNRTAD